MRESDGEWIHHELLMVKQSMLAAARIRDARAPYSPPARSSKGRARAASISSEFVRAWSCIHGRRGGSATTAKGHQISRLQGCIRVVDVSMHSRLRVAASVFFGIDGRYPDMSFVGDTTLTQVGTFACHVDRREILA
jgi:hypothetical protein